MQPCEVAKDMMLQIRNPKPEIRTATRSALGSILGFGSRPALRDFGLRISDFGFSTRA